MSSTEQLDYSETPLCEAVIGATMAIRTDFPALSVEEQLAALVAEARDYVSHEQDADLKLEKLLELFKSCWSCFTSSGNLAVPAASITCQMRSGWIKC